ncbi:MAG: ribose transport system ATP-binding protein [Pseudothermotoga sp.]|jgi:ribose transport system ATP-binding protein|nr:sugar ABC transporter ATP-binding protein [Pseudothermotoga lettingae]KUK21011.1 MAG: ABC transporter related [Pseudothermotoga lettingae]MDI3495797.1 ribose transport system ATP-binding protein [Pseudothermotoga sp.]HBT26239.1 sugar ABC transporter ATP-binding protein [Pseudothermotoga sp.]
MEGSSPSPLHSLSEVVILQLLQARNIIKSFPGVLAVDDVDFEVGENEIVSIVGENGAGKSTLIKVLSGILKPDSGEIFFNGEKVEFHSPFDAFIKGISAIHQELNLCENLTVAENIFLAFEAIRGKRRSLSSRLDENYMRRKSEELLNLTGARFSSNTLVRELTTAQRQMVEICKALIKEPRIIFMDEPTSSLTVEETERLFEIIHMLKDRGISVVFVSHRLDEVAKISDRVIVMRDGKKVGELKRAEFDMDTVIKLMVGREVEFFPHGTEVSPGEVVLKVENLRWKNRVKNVSFQVRKGEILGFAGLVGAGRTETMLLIFGINKKEDGEIFIKGNKVNIERPLDATKLGIGLVPEDRKLQGLVLKLTVKDNMVLPSLSVISNHGWILNERKEKMIAENFVKKLSIKTPSVYQITENLSGGNQQKIVLAKWLATNADILIFDEPTRGIDVATKAEIHRMIRELAAQGKTILMISSELPEILNLSDRIVVMWEGEITAILDNKSKKVSQEEIMYYASGKLKQSGR